MASQLDLCHRRFRMEYCKSVSLAKRVPDIILVADCAQHHTRPTKPCSCILKALVTRLTWVDIRTFKEEREAVPRVYCTQTRPPIQCVLTETRPISARSPKQPITDYDQRPGSVRLSSFILKNELKSLQNMCETEVARQPCDQLP